MERRAILAIVLSVLVLIVYQKWALREQPKKQGEREEIERIEPMPSAPEVSEKSAGGELYEGAEERKGEGFVSREIEKEGETELRDIRVETSLYSAIFSSYGGRLKSWRLYHYMNVVEHGRFVRWFQETEKKVKRLFGFGGKTVPEGKPEPVELVATEELVNLPMAIEVEDVGGKVGFAPMDVDSDSILLGGNKSEGALLFSGSSPGGLEISKGYRFFDNEYRVDMEVRIKNRGIESRKVRLALVWFGMMMESGSRAFSGPVAMVDGKVSEIKAKKFKKEELLLSGNIRWFGSSMGEKNVRDPKKRKPFFVSLIVPKETEGIKLKIGMKDEKLMYSRAIYPVRSIPGGGEAVYSYELYLGPKVIDLLKELNVGAEKVVRFGWFTSIAKILLLFINLTHRVTENYGVDIIIISILLKILFWPLTKKSYVSMKEMQKVQPEMTMLREKYKNDKARLNREMMDLYKRRKVNPLGGCLPMLVQIPIFFALYWALMGSIELRHAPFILWIRDLSYRDPIYISPLLMGASMVWQQKMTPTMGDPRQAKMMMFMPIIFTFIFLSFPAGLVIYWLVTNILTIGQQYFINKALK
ncbi:MAG: membrane protein insertase YidC [Syntrophobacterales bacterium]|nr:MAG: membrane protein insertase YidC [Syntrophobacterales bacterium]